MNFAFTLIAKKYSRNILAGILQKASAQRLFEFRFPLSNSQHQHGRGTLLPMCYEVHCLAFMMLRSVGHETREKAHVKA